MEVWWDFCFGLLSAIAAGLYCDAMTPRVPRTVVMSHAATTWAPLKECPWWQCHVSRRIYLYPMDPKTHQKTTPPPPSTPSLNPTPVNVSTIPSLMDLEINPPLDISNKRGLKEEPFKFNRFRRRQYKDTETGLNVNQEEKWPKYFVIKKREGDFSKASPFWFCSSIINAVGKVKMVKKMANGTLHVEADTKLQAEQLVKLEKLGDVEVSVDSNRRLNTSKGVITSRDFLWCSEEEIQNGMADLGVIEVKRIMRKQGNLLEPTESLVLTFDQPKPPESIVACYIPLRVRPYIPSPMRCFKCLRFGHTSLRCRSEQKICNCGLPEHEGTPCQDPPTCVNCGNWHTSRSPECIIFQKEKEIQRIKTIQNLSYPEARKIVSGKSYAKPQISFASAVTSKTPPVNVTNLQKAMQNQLNLVNEGTPASNLLETQTNAEPTLLRKEPTPVPIPASGVPVSTGTPPISTPAFKPPAGVKPLKFPPRSPQKRELRSKAKGTLGKQPSCAVNAALIDESSREEGGSDSESCESNKTVLHERPAPQRQQKRRMSRRTKIPRTTTSE